MALAETALAEVDLAAAARFLAALARWWRRRARRFWARELSVTCPLDLDLAVVLDEAAKSDAHRIKDRATTKRSLSRSVMRVTKPPTTRGNYCCTGICGCGRV